MEGFDKSWDELVGERILEGLRLLLGLQKLMSCQRAVQLLEKAVFKTRDLSFARQVAALLQQSTTEGQETFDALASAFAGDPEAVEAYLKKYPQTRSYETNVLHMAALGNSVNVLQILPKAFYKLRNKSSETGLILACRAGNLEAAAYLLPLEQGMKDDLRVTGLWHLMNSNEPSVAVNHLVEEMMRYKDEMYSCVDEVHCWSYMGQKRKLNSVDKRRFCVLDCKGRNLVWYALRGNAASIQRHFRGRRLLQHSSNQQSVLTYFTEQNKTDQMQPFLGLAEVISYYQRHDMLEPFLRVKDKKVTAALRAVLADRFLTDGSACFFKLLDEKKDASQHVRVSKSTLLAGLAEEKYSEEATKLVATNPLWQKEAELADRQNKFKVNKPPRNELDALFDDFEGAYDSPIAEEIIQKHPLCRGVSLDAQFHRRLLWEAVSVQEEMPQSWSSLGDRRQGRLRLQLAVLKQGQKIARSAMVGYLKAFTQD